MRDQSFDATAKIFIRGTLKTREVLSGLDVVGADSFCILIYKARGLNADQQSQRKQDKSQIRS
jgi:hypothetical protein